MPLNHFNVHNSIGFVPDEEGRILPDLAAARSSGIADVRFIISEEACSGHADLRGRIEVTDGTVAMLLVIPFAEAVRIQTE